MQYLPLFLETGRVEMLYQNEGRLIGHGNSYVIASLQLDLVAEIKWPGTVEIGTAVSKVGNSSIKFISATVSKWG